MASEKREDLGQLEKVKIYDFDNKIFLYDIQKKPLKPSQINFSSLINILYQTTFNNFHYLVTLFFLSYFFYNKGLLAAPFLLLSYSYILCLEAPPTQMFWKYCFLYCSFLLTFKTALLQKGL